MIDREAGSAYGRHRETWSRVVWAAVFFTAWQAVGPSTYVTSTYAADPKQPAPERAALPPAVAIPTGVVVESSEPLVPVKFDDYVAGTPPKYLAGATVMTRGGHVFLPNHEQGRITIKPAVDGPLMMAVVWEPEGTKGGEWSKEVNDHVSLLRSGWALIGELTFRDSAIRPHRLYWRNAKAGETLVVRTARLDAPMVVVAAAGAPAPWKEIPAVELPPRLGVFVLRNAAYQLLVEKQYDTLEDTLDHFRKTNGRLRDGASKLHAFYGGLQARTGEGLDDWRPAQDRLEAWVKARPLSKPARLALAQFWEQYAWHARGGGFAGTVSEEGGKLYRERVTKAREVLEEAKRLEGKDPHQCSIEMDLAIDLGYSSEEVYRILNDCRSFDPDYISPYIDAARYFLPRWHGDDGELEEFALKAVEMTKPDWGRQIYLLIVWEAMRYHGDMVFEDFAFDWDVILKGLDDSRKRFPDAADDIERVCQLACLRGDRDTARKLFPLFPATEGGVWRNLEQWRRWADEDYLSGDQVAICDGVRRPIWICEWFPDGRAFAVFNSAANLGIWSADGKTRFSEFKYVEKVPIAMHIADDERTIFAANWGNAVVKIDLQTGHEETFAKYKERISAAAVTPDGKKFMVADAGTQFMFFDVATGRIVDNWPAPVGDYVTSMAFTPDGQMLLTAMRDGNVLFWDVATKKQLSEIPTGHNGGKTIRVSGDGRLLVVLAGKTLKVWSLADGQELGSLPFPEQGITDLALSPDGKRLAAGCRGKKDSDPADVVIWDVDAMKILHTYHGHKRFIRTVRFSRDGKQLLSGSDDMSVRFWKVD